MAALPLTLDTLESPTPSPLLSPHMVEPSTTSTPNERPSALTLDGPQQQPHSNLTPTSAAHGNISPALSSVGSLSPSFLPEMPQWKRDLIQRRKQNVQRASPTAAMAASSSSSSPLSSPSITQVYGLKTSTSSSSVRSLAGSNTANTDQVASDGLYSPTKDFNKLSSPSSAATATKVNKQHATTIPATIKSTSAAATTSITSPNKEKTAKLFGGQYTAIATSTTAATAAPTLVAATATVNTKEEITKDTMEEEYLEKSKNTKEYHTTTTTTTSSSNNTRTIKTLEEEEEEEQNITTTTTIKHQHQQQQHQMATRLTGSSSYTSSSTTTNNNKTTTSSALQSSKREFSGEREQQASSGSGAGAVVGHQQQCYNITGANNGSANQSSSKCESERLVCAVNNSGSSLLATTTTSNVVKISQKLQENQFIKNEQQHKTKILKFKTTTGASNINSDLKSPTTTATATSSPLSATNNCAITKKMVAMQEMKKSTQNTATHLHPINSTCSANTNTAASNGNGRSNRIGGVSQNSNDLDSNEDLSYGPGIVSKLRCRYLSLALRESMEQQRLNKDLLRRSTSLNNLLDDDHDDNADEEEEDEEEEDNMDNIGGEEEEQQKIADNLSQKKAGILKNSCTAQEKRFSQGSNGVGVTFTETSFNKRSRHLKRGNDSLKRARSVEALLSEKSPWQGNLNRNSTPTCVTIEDKIQNARERLHQGSDHMPPKRLTSIIDDTERPPPDLVKQTLKMFEASANRRPRCTNRSNSKGEVASKVETFKNIIKDQKPVVTYPKPVSPTKKLNTPPTLVKPLKASTQASDLLQTPLGRKAMAVANSHGPDALSGKPTNTLSEHTPDIIPRQKLHSERESNKEKYTMGINKEKFMNSLMEPPLSTTNVVDSTLKSTAKEKFLASMVDSPVTALSKELENMKLTENSTPRKADNFMNDNKIARSNGGSVSSSGGGGGGVDGCSGGVDDAFHNDDQYKSEEIAEMNTNEFSSLKSENDKIKQQQINNEIQSNSSATAGVAIVASPAHEATVKAHNAHSSSDLSDGEDDDEYGISTTKRITRTALDNIAKAGTTQQFKFSSTTHSASSNNTQHTSLAGKQIGVIRPLLNTNNSTATTTSNTTQKVATESITNMETLKHHTTPSALTSREIEKNRINDLKKSSSTTMSSSPSSTVVLSPSASLDNVIKSHNATSTSSSSASSAASGYSEVDTVISATNSPLWAMRKRRQNPPAAPAENTSMVFNFSNRKEVPDYIESDGVIFRRKRELPKPNESGFVLLGDLSVETSTDMDYDDFSMCPPSPCDVEFVNANIVIDGKSSIRQKSKDASFRVQFNDTLTSTFEYPSEASLIVEDSFTALSNEYPLPGESDFNQAFQNLVLESYAAASSDDANAIMPPLHHVADEIIQLPTTTESSSSPANTTATKNILGNLPLDCPDLEKATPLTVVAMQATHESNDPHHTQDHNSNILKRSSSSRNGTDTGSHLQELPKSLEIRKSRKDLKLPLLLLEQPQSGQPKPPVPLKSCQMMTTRKPLYSKASVNPKQIELKVTGIPGPRTDIMNIRKQQQQQQSVPPPKPFEDTPKTRDSNDNPLCVAAPTTEPNQMFSEYEQHPIKMEQRKIPRVLSNPQYACFLRQPEPVWQKSVQRSRSNEFRKTTGTNFVATTVLRSNSLRNLEKTQAAATATTPTIVTTSLYFTPEVNSSRILSNRAVRKAIDPANANSSPTNAKVDDPTTTKSVSLNNLTFAVTNDTNTVPIPSDADVITSCLSLSNLQYIANNNEESTESSVEEQSSLLLTKTTTLSLPNLNEATEEIIGGHHSSCSSTGTTEYSCSLPNITKALNSTNDLTDYSAANSNSEYSPEILENITLSLPNLNSSSSPAHSDLNTYSTGIPINVSSSFAELSDRPINVTDVESSSLPNLIQCPSSANHLSELVDTIVESSTDDKNPGNITKIPDANETNVQCSGERTENVANPVIPRCNPSLLLTKDELSMDSLDDEYEDALNQQLENIINENGGPESNVELTEQTYQRKQLCANESLMNVNCDEYSYDLVINELPIKVSDGPALNSVDSKNYDKSESIEISKTSFNSFDLKHNDESSTHSSVKLTQERESFDYKAMNGKERIQFPCFNSKKDLDNNDDSVEVVGDFMNTPKEFTPNNVMRSVALQKPHDFQNNNEISSDVRTSIRDPLVSEFTALDINKNNPSKVANSSDDQKIVILNTTSKFSLINDKVDNEKLKKSFATTSDKLSSSASHTTSPPETPLRTFNVRTNDKFVNVSHKTTSNDVATYSTFESARKKYNRNISKSFKNALTLYESFNNGKSNDEKNTSAVQRTASLMENSSSARSRLYHANTGNRTGFQTASVSDLSTSAECGSVGMSETTPKKSNQAIDNINGNITCATMPLALKAPSQIFFNTSPRPFRRAYEPTTSSAHNSSSVFDCSSPISPNILPVVFKQPQIDATQSVGNLRTPEVATTFAKVYRKHPIDLNTLAVTSPKPTTSIICHTFVNVSPNLSSAVDPTIGGFCPCSVTTTTTTPTTDLNNLNTNNNNFHLPTTQMGSKTRHTTPTLLPVKATGTLNGTANVQVLKSTNIEGPVAGFSKSTNFLETTISCSPTSCSTSTSCSSRFTSSTTTTTTTNNNNNMTKVHATAKCRQRSEIRSAIPPKVMPRRLFATTPPSIKTTNTINTKTVTATTTINSSPSSISNSFKASSYTNSTTTSSTSATTLCAPPLRRRIPGNTLYYV